MNRSTILLDMTRSVSRHMSGATPSGIDRVCDAYVARFAGRARAVLQLGGRSVVLGERASDRLVATLDAPAGQLRIELAAMVGKALVQRAGTAKLRRPVYLNVGHSGFDRDIHWRSLRAPGLKRCYLLHDLIPLTHPHVTIPRKTDRHRGRVVNALSHADGIVANSHATAQDLRDFAHGSGLALPRLLVAPIAGGQLPLATAPVLMDRPYFVSVGTIEIRKNHALLLRAWSRLIDRMGGTTPRLVLAGNWGLQSDRVRATLRNDPRLGEFVEFRTGLGDAEIAALMAGAQAVLLPTLAEGYGLPMVEALQLGTPVIASDLPSFREIGQGIPTLLSPLDSEAWARAVAGFCAGSEERRRQEASMGGFRPPSWESHFRDLEHWLENLVAGGQETVWGNDGTMGGAANAASVELDRAAGEPGFSGR